MRVGTRVRPAARHSARFLRAMRASVGCSSTPTTARKGYVGREQQSAAHACAEIDERVGVDGRDGPAAPPAHQNALKDRGRNGVVGRDVAIVPVPGVKMTAGDQSAGTHAKLQVEGMADEPVFHRQTRQKTRLCGCFFSCSWRALAHA